MSIDAALAGVNLLGVDTAPFIYFIEKHPVYVDQVRAIFQRVNTGMSQVITSVITLTEVLGLPLEMQHLHFESEYRAMLLNTDGITTLPVSIPIAEQAARLRATYKLRTPDALHVATAIVSHCDAFLTNDLQLRRITEIKILVLDNLET